LTLNARNVEEGGLVDGHNKGGADSMAELWAYDALKRLITVRTSLFLVPLVAIATWRNPVAGLQLALGGAVGVLNMLAMMRSNERLLDGRSNRAVFALSNQIRIFAVGVLPVVVALRVGQFWTVGLFIAGFFTPLALYAREYHRIITRGD
jgi:hypothetical protein